MELHAKLRKDTSNSHTRKLREDEKVPAVLYGRDVETINLTLVEHEIRELLRKGALNNVLVELELDEEDEERQILIKDADIHPVSSELLHVDLHQVSSEERVQVEIPVKLVGEAPGVEQENGILDKPIRSLEIDCKADNIPEHIEVPIDELEIGDALFVSEISASGDVKILTQSDRVLVSVQPPEEFDLEVTPAAEVPTIEETVEEALEETEEGEEAEEGEEEAEEGEEGEEAAEEAAPET